MVSQDASCEAGPSRPRSSPRATPTTSAAMPKARPPPISKSTSTTPDPFASLPQFDAGRFEPPAWAQDAFHRADTRSKNGESFSSVPTSRNGRDDRISSEFQTSKNGPFSRPADQADDEVEVGDTESLGLSDQEEVWEDAVQDQELGVDQTTGDFTLTELKRLFEKASTAKTEGNAHFTARPSRYEEAISSYRSALGYLPAPLPPQEPNEESKGTAGETNEDRTATDPNSDLKPTSAKGEATATATSKSPPPAPAGSGIQELTEEEAAALEAELSKQEAGSSDNGQRDKEEKSEEEERGGIMQEVKELRKVCWANLGAVYLAREGHEAECVKACDEALKIDPRYSKALQRRATANERIGTWSALSSAQEDYTTLLSLLPPAHPSLPTIRRSLLTLPDRIKLQQEKEKDEMISKLKDLGNGLLGRFGLSTDMFKFDQQEGGGYSMRFER